jgi:hypothetical protein
MPSEPRSRSALPDAKSGRPVAIGRVVRGAAERPGVRRALLTVGCGANIVLEPTWAAIDMALHKDSAPVAVDVVKVAGKRRA